MFTQTVVVRRPEAERPLDVLVGKRERSAKYVAVETGRGRKAGVSYFSFLEAPLKPSPPALALSPSNLNTSCHPLLYRS